VEFGLPQCFDGAIRTEMAVFGHLIQREEPRNMIQTLFLAKTQYDRLAKQQKLPEFVRDAVATAKSAIEVAGSDHPALTAAGWFRNDERPRPVRSRATSGYWIDGPGEESAAARSIFERIGTALAPLAGSRSAGELRLADYAIVKETGYPPYLGGPFAFMARRCGFVGASS
jgi:3-hydroxyacyl-CoA dehydrogenase/enoyl-CoA hydratase/3-hydroxybutyryl-CoA epimerase